MIRTVELAKPAMTISPGRMRRMGATMLVVGASALLMGIALLVMVLSGKGEPAMLLMETFLGLPGGFMVWHGIKQLRAAHGLQPGDVVMLSAPHAFQITDSTLLFPAFYGRPADVWQRQDTKATVGSFLRMSTLTLENPGHRRRRFFGWRLRQTPEQVLKAMRRH